MNDDFEISADDGIRHLLDLQHLINRDLRSIAFHGGVRVTHMNRDRLVTAHGQETGRDDVLTCVLLDGFPPLHSIYPALDSIPFEPLRHLR